MKAFLFTLCLFGWAFHGAISAHVGTQYLLKRGRNWTALAWTLLCGPIAWLAIVASTAKHGALVLFPPKDPNKCLNCCHRLQLHDRSEEHAFEPGPDGSNGRAIIERFGICNVKNCHCPGGKRRPA